MRVTWLAVGLLASCGASGGAKVPPPQGVPAGITVSAAQRTPRASTWGDD